MKLSKWYIFKLLLACLVLLILSCVVYINPEWDNLSESVKIAVVSLAAVSFISIFVKEKL